MAALKSLPSIKSFFRRLPEPRVKGRSTHLLIDVIVIAICGVIADCDDFREIEQFAKERVDWFKSFLKLSGGIPSHDTFERIFAVLDTRTLHSCCLQWLTAVTGALDVGHIAIDGKTSRGSAKAGIGALHVGGAWATGAQVSPGGVAGDKKKLDGENKEFSSNKMKSANWMIQAFEQRRQTMLKVMHFIVDRQRDFFEKGVQYLKPLTLREVAEVINMHESTVSRVTNEKYVQTPLGVLPLKFFFSSGLSTTGGEDVSARGIKAQIEKLVADEDPKHPLTDQAIVNILKEGGVQIARRTVAKYRDQLGVLSARMRKRV